MFLLDTEPSESAMGRLAPETNENEIAVAPLADVEATSPMDDAVKWVVDALVDDWVRCDGALTTTMVERLCAKRGLDARQRTLVTRTLRQLDIELLITAPKSPAAMSETLATGSESFLRHRILSSDEEIALGRKVSYAIEVQKELNAGRLVASEETTQALAEGRNARETLLNHNYRLVLAAAREWARRTDVPLDDLFQIGILGLCRAVERFDHSLGFKFSTYATWWIRQAISRNLDDNWSLIRLPVHAATAVRKLRFTLATWGGERKRQPTLAELSEKTELTVKQLEYLLPYVKEHIESLDEPRGREGEKPPVPRKVVSREMSPLQHCEAAELRRLIEEALGSLTKREKEIVEWRFGLHGGKEKTLEEIGQIYGVTRERIRQIEAIALVHLRHPARTRKLKQFFEKS